MDADKLDTDSYQGGITEQSPKPSGQILTSDNPPSSALSKGNLKSNTANGSVELATSVRGINRSVSYAGDRTSVTPSVSFLPQKRPEDEIEHRLFRRSRVIDHKMGKQNDEVVMVPLLVNSEKSRRERHLSEESWRSVSSYGDVDSDSDGRKYNLTYVDLMSMQMYATPPSERVISVLKRRDSEEFHPVFCEVETLQGEKEDALWKQKARWVKYEECIEDSGDRWSKPHVSMLSLQSLFEVRKCFLTGTVLLDLEAHSWWDVTENIVQQLVLHGQLKETDRQTTKEILHARHQHGVKEEGCGLIEAYKARCKKDVKNVGAKRATYHKFNKHFLRKVPTNSEAINILVGEAKFLKQPVSAFVRLQSPLLFKDMPEVEIASRFVFVLLLPWNEEYEEVGRAMATIMSDEVFREIAYHAENRSDLLAGVDEFMTQVTVLPPGKFDPEERIEPPYTAPSQKHRLDLRQSRFSLSEEEDKSLVRTGRIFGGLIADIKRRYPQYGSDIKDAFHLQCVAALLFMYIACLTPVVTIGGLLGQATDKNMGAIEALVSAAICGTTYFIFSGQPLTIIGATGPVLVFEKIMYPLCQNYGIHYLPFRFWIGIWMSLILLVIVMFDLSCLVRYITRFTEEGFAMLIAMIFIFESFRKVLHIMYEFPVDWHPDEAEFHDYTCFCAPPANSSFADIVDNNTLLIQRLDPWILSYKGNVPVYKETGEHTHNHSAHTWDAISMSACTGINGTLVGVGCSTPHYVADVFFFSCTLFLATFTIAVVLKNFRTSQFCSNRVRTILSDFAVPIAILSMAIVDHFVGIHTPKLIVPDEIRPTSPHRGWIINPLDNPLWCIPAAIIPALLAAVLIFMDQQITAVIVNRREHKLKKGCGYHLDLTVVACQIAVCSVIGTPWFIAATMESINHVRSLSRESETSAPGERPKFLGVREQRVTGFLTFTLIGSSVFLSVMLQYIPMPVLFGVFLFMGVSAMKNIQLVQRILIIFMPTKYQPDYTFLRHVKLRRVHLFTGIQVLCLVCLWTVKMTKLVSILFPLMVLALCFVRKAMDWIFTTEEMKWLDDILPESEKQELLDDPESLEEDVDDEKEAEMKELLKEDSVSTEEMTINGGIKDKNLAKVTVMVENSDDENHNTKV